MCLCACVIMFRCLSMLNEPLRKYIFWLVKNVLMRERLQCHAIHSNMYCLDGSWKTALVVSIIAVYNKREVLPKWKGKGQQRIFINSHLFEIGAFKFYVTSNSRDAIIPNDFIQSISLKQRRDVIVFFFHFLMLVNHER